jgi:hypothetical protein
VTAGELALVVAAVLCALAFAAVVVTLVRVRDLVAELRGEVADLRVATARAEEVTVEALAEARDDLDRFDRVLGSAEAISSAVGRTNRATRAALSTPVIKAAGIATGTSRAVKKLRSGT